MQSKFKHELFDIKKGNKSTRNVSITDNTNILFNQREKILKLCNDYTELMSETKCCSLQGKGIKRLAPKQKLERLPKAFVQVKSGNTSEILLNKIRQIIYFLYQLKEVTEKVYKNSIQI